MHLEATSLGVCCALRAAQGVRLLRTLAVGFHQGCPLFPVLFIRKYRKHETSAELMKQTEDTLEKCNLVMVAFTVCDG